jgi:hypothetical protein
MIRIHSETITHGQRYLLSLLDSRSFFSFTESIGLSFTYMHKVAAGINKPPCQDIYIMRNIIHPALWFLEEHEAVPENSYKPTRKKEWDWRNSLGMRQLLELTAGDVRAWALQNGLPYFSVWALTDKTHQPSYNKILMVKEHIDPASWFFYEYVG